ncbi:glycosyltransferase WbsX family protein [Niabella drilacis]|uniref:Glycosyltransferase WbsX n=1 Tax=Niabella drilacis (strain DSM 25811 / CCM 8410 / CCUG 62505 / LMG 26954 / E90) TaxID=1285928 RepID=A0A1G6ZZ28_NIADE|nr:glycoside hydrolase family 99-like domain-containing protein [Niabella drilacis]SDE07934.1 Glycosyltransferase WbsX [Niabella drilacis]
MNNKDGRKDIKCLAFYLPQYHPIPENDEWWGKGFTEWTNVTRAKPLFRGHQQPVFPADLGYYDLRVPEVREAQAKMAKAHGVHGFIYYHYWFGNGKQLLERPLNDMVALEKPDFPFCICWANETWSGIWYGAPDQTLIRQEYPGNEDIVMHFDYLVKIFEDPRYIRVNGLPLFMIYNGLNLPDSKSYTDKLREEAVKRGLGGLYIMGSNLHPDSWDFEAAGFDGRVSYAYNKVQYQLMWEAKRQQQKTRDRFLRKIFSKNNAPRVTRIDQRTLVENIIFEDQPGDIYPMILPNWDNTPRSAHNGVVIQNTSPELFETQIRNAIDYINSREMSDRFMILKSWNEWAEGNYVEPDSRNGYVYLDVLKKYLTRAGV